MFFTLKKLITLLILPLSFSLLAGSAGAVLIWRKRTERIGRWLLVTSIAVLVVFSNKGVSQLLLKGLEHEYAAVPEARTAEALPRRVRDCAAIVVLGGGHGDAPGLSRVSQLSTAALARTAEAVRLWRLMPEAVFVVSGHHIGPYTHAQVLGEAAESLGVPKYRISRMDAVRDTEDEMNELAKRFGKSPVAIVTSGWHMPRSMYLARSAGLNAVACPTDFMLKPGADRGLALLGCDLGALERSTKAIHEYVGLLWLKMKGK